MIKRILCILAVLSTALIFTGCGPSEENVQIPLHKPGEGGPEPASVTGAAGAAPAPSSEGGTAKPATE